MAIYDFFLSRNNGATAETHVGHAGRLFYDSEDGLFRLSDGTTPGGKVVANLALASVGVNEPIKPFEGEMWYNPSTKELWAYYNGAFRGTINPATETMLGGIKAGPGLIVASDGTVSLDSTGIPFNFGDFYAFTNPGPSDGACLSSINANQNINIVSNGTGSINAVGEFCIYATNETLEGALSTTPRFRANAEGQVRILVPTPNILSGGLQVVGNISGIQKDPVNQGVMLHITGHDGIEARSYVDSIGGYAGFVGRRSNGTSQNPTGVLENDEVSRYAANAYTSDDGYGPVGIGQLRWYASENITSTNKGGRAEIWVVPVGAADAQKIIKVDGNGITVSANKSVKFTASTLTTPVTGSLEYTGKVFTATPIDEERGLLLAEQKYILNANRTLNNDLLPQSLFGAGFHVTAGTRYRYQILCTITKTGGNSVAIGYGLSVNNGGALGLHTYRVVTTVGETATSPSPVYAMRNSVTTGFDTPVNVTGSLTNGASGSTFDIQGVIECTTSGYVTPQVTFLTAAPTGALVLRIATIRIYPVGPTGANTIIGNWI